MKVQTKVRAGGIQHGYNHNQTAVKVKSGVRAGGMNMQHNQTLARPKPPAGVKVKTSVKAGKHDHGPEI